MPISMFEGRRCASVEKFTEVPHPAPSQSDSMHTSYSTMIQSTRPGPAPRGIIKAGPQQRPLPAGGPLYRPLPAHAPVDGRPHQLADVYSNSGDTVQFAGNLRKLINDHVPFFVWVAFAALEIILGLVSVFFGAYNYSMCDVQEYIPLYLVLSGSALIVHGVIRLARSIPSLGGGPARRRSLYPDLCIHGVEALAVLYMVTCVILGCVWVYGYRSRYAQFYQHMFEYDYCDKTLYWVAWWSVTLHLVVFTLFVLALILVIAYGSLVSDN